MWETHFGNTGEIFTLKFSFQMGYLPDKIILLILFLTRKMLTIIPRSKIGLILYPKKIKGKKQ